MNRRSERLDLLEHFFFRKALVHEQQMANNLADGPCSGRTISDSSVQRAEGVQSNEVTIVRNENAAFPRRKGQLFHVGRTDELGVGARRHVDRSPAQSAGNRVVDIFVKMKPHRRPRACRRASWQEAQDRSPTGIVPPCRCLLSSADANRRDDQRHTKVPHELARALNAVATRRFHPESAPPSRAADRCPRR